MKLRICGLANIAGSAAFILFGCFSAVASAETPVERGAYLVNSIGQCGNCHGRDAQGNYHPGRALAGGFIFDVVDPDLPGHVVAPNITPDRDTGIGKWSKADIIVALRNGKRPDGSIIGPPMPIPMYRQLSDQDATAIATYLFSLPSVKNSVQNSQYKIKLTEYGPPVTHVDAFGPIGQTGPSISRNITSDPEQGIGKWSDNDIKEAITKGIRPDGTKLAGPMPYDMYAKMTPNDLDAIVAFMRTIKPVKIQ
jgi:mono/diheme cytochrome c family protein